jgi:5,10-methylenetetrahydromethanopterin reductase
MTKAALPDIGLRLSGALAPRRCVELAQAAEAAGFASIWFAENPFQRGVLATAGACAAATRRVRIGVGVVNPYNRHPTLIAMEFAALDELSEGRVVLGIGSGIAAAVQRLGIPADRPVTSVREAIAIIRAMLSGDRATLSGRVFSVDGVQLSFQPRRGIPLYMAAASNRALRSCGELADGLIVSNMTPVSLSKQMIATVAETAARTGRPKPIAVQYVPCAVSTDRNAAYQAAKAAIGEGLTLLWPVGNDWPKRREAVVAESGIPRHDFAVALGRLRRGEDAVSVLDERFVAAFAIAGTIEECLEQAARFRATGVDELVLTFAGDRPMEDIADFGCALQ